MSQFSTCRESIIIIILIKSREEKKDLNDQRSEEWLTYPSCLALVYQSFFSIFHSLAHVVNRLVDVEFDTIDRFSL